ncbi:hypothetical protein SARC_11425 [Sphaeroforma arctica JP610]|uniref:Uncharacterized protein n=1 Tax=Sphaeroforma arctica JP610 TaxID=667725 RepID=A0A0L0FH26_9EUKA|nr:hypothetical protein SARC_11425 [Sphaeroforma arctica JP610]KNC76064.1 hypothetical protein SARC_11425 [Sphaeroforma arctica JP610]|eukprot:XP_014149966.1 hypothetical protein SARC_11425 [Sphaeroforma arctica JP610]
MNGINGLPRLALADLCLAALSREDITRLTLDVDSKTMLPLMPTKYSQRTSTNGSEQNYYDWAPLFDTVKPDSKFLPEVYHSFPIAITVVLGVTIPIVATLLLLLLRLVGLRT